MSERSDLLGKIAGTIGDYRMGEIAVATPAHVDQWVDQFDTGKQLQLLREMDHVLERAYFEKSWVLQWLENLTTNTKLTGQNPKDYWNSANFLSIQKNGSSQQEMLAEFKALLERSFSIDIDQSGSPDGPWIYLDDAIFTGGRVGDDLEEWIRVSPSKTIDLHVVVIVAHKLADWQVKNRLSAVAKAADKKLTINIWRAVTLENRKTYKNSSEVLWPADIPDSAELATYMAEEEKYPFEPRSPQKQFSSRFFSSEEGRQLLEQEFLSAGLKIRSFSDNPSRGTRPLGFSPFGLGFGSIIVTYRNCPNNCPLALWWGDPSQPSWHPLSKWYPLFPRKTYGD